MNDLHRHSVMKRQYRNANMSQNSSDFGDNSSQLQLGGGDANNSSNHRDSLDAMHNLGSINRHTLKAEQRRKAPTTLESYRSTSSVDTVIAHLTGGGQNLKSRAPVKDLPRIKQHSVPSTLALNQSNRRMNDTVKSGEAEIQTSSHSSTRSKRGAIMSKVPFEGFTHTKENDGALKIIEDLNGSELESQQSPKSQKRYQKQSPRPQKAISPKLIKPIFTNIVTAQQQSQRHVLNPLSKRPGSKGDWKKLTITTGEFVYPQSGTGIISTLGVNFPNTELQQMKKQHINRSLIYKPKIQSKTALKKAQFHQTQGAIPFAKFQPKNYVGESQESNPLKALQDVSGIEDLDNDLGTLPSFPPLANIDIVPNQARGSFLDGFSTQLDKSLYIKQTLLNQGDPRQYSYYPDSITGADTSSFVNHKIMPQRRYGAGSLTNARQLIKGVKVGAELSRQNEVKQTSEQYFYMRAHMNNTLQKDLPRGVLNYPPL